MTAGAHMTVTIPAGRAHATCIRVWKRAETELHSGNSGPKETFHNYAAILFGRFQDATRVALISVQTRGAQFLFLVEIAGRWLDVRGLQPFIEEEAKP